MNPKASLQQAVGALRKNFKDALKNPKLFLEAVDQLVLEAGASCIPELLVCFEDATEAGGVGEGGLAEGLLCALAAFPREVFLEAFFTHVHRMLPHGMGWAAKLLEPFFSGEGEVALVRQILRQTLLQTLGHPLYVAQREALLELFAFMDRHFPLHQKVIAPLRQDVLDRVCP